MSDFKLEAKIHLRIEGQVRPIKRGSALFKPIIGGFFVIDINFDCLLCVFFFAQPARAQQEDPFAQTLDTAEIMADQKNRSALAADGSPLFKTLLLESQIAYGDDLVQQQNFRLEMGRDRKRQS